MPGSDGGSFVAQSNDAVTVQVTNQGGAADPYAFFDGSQYILYVPTFNGPLPLQQISVYTSPTIGGPYTLFSGLPSGALSTGGGQASGFHNAALGQYWHYENGVSAVYEAIASTLDQQISLPPQPPAPPGGPPPPGTIRATPVITPETLGLPPTTSIQHPKFAPNTP